MCMIVKNEESILENSLTSLRDVCDEIVIVDTGSNDNTIEIARRYADTIDYFEWMDDFAAARNFATSLCTHDYIMTWDADYLLPNNSAAIIQRLKLNDFADHNLIQCRWFTEFDSQSKPTRGMWRELIFRKRDYEWKSPIHNYLQIKPNILPSVGRYKDLMVEHWKDPNLKKTRYAQTKSILEKYILNKRNDYDSKEFERMALFYAQSLMFEGEYANAEIWLSKLLRSSVANSNRQKLAFLLEKTLQCYFFQGKIQACYELLESLNIDPAVLNHPRSVLILADLTAMSDPKSAIDLYLKYLQDPFVFDEKTDYDWDRERFESHPRLMLCKLYLALGDEQKAKKYGISFLDNSTNFAKKSQIKKLLESI